MDYVLVFLLGMAVMFIPAALWAASKRRPAAATVSQAQEHGPIIILPPASQPVTHNYTNNYYDNRRVVAPQSLSNEQPQLVAQQPLVRAQRVFKVVGEEQL